MPYLSGGGQETWPGSLIMVQRPGRRLCCILCVLPPFASAAFRGPCPRQGSNKCPPAGPSAPLLLRPPPLQSGGHLPAQGAIGSWALGTVKRPAVEQDPQEVGHRLVIMATARSAWTALQIVLVWQQQEVIQ